MSSPVTEALSTKKLVSEPLTQVYTIEMSSHHFPSDATTSSAIDTGLVEVSTREPVAEEEAGVIDEVVSKPFENEGAKSDRFGRDPVAEGHKRNAVTTSAPKRSHNRGEACRGCRVGLLPIGLYALILNPTRFD